MKVDLSWLKSWHLVAFICVVITVSYIQVFHNGFVWDDTRLIVTNQGIGDINTLPKLFQGQSLFESYGQIGKKHIYYKPLLGVWWMSNYALWGGAKAWGFHATQLALHLVNVALVFVLVKELAKQYLSDKTSKIPQTLAFWIALLWGLHPANSESIVYVAAGQEPLYLFWGLLSFYLVLKRESLSNWLVEKGKWEAEKSPNLIAVLVGICWLLSLLSKEAGIVVAPIVVLYLVVVAQDQDWKRFAKVLIGTWTVYFLMRFWLGGVALASRSDSIPIHRASFFERLLTIPYVLFEHLRVISFPVDLFTGNFVVIEAVSLDLMLKVVVLVGVFVLMVLLARKDRFLKWLLLSGVLSIGLVSNLFPLDMTFSERWVYLPSLFFIWFWIQFLSKRLVWLAPLLMIIVSLFAVRVYARVPNWQSEYTLAQHDKDYDVDGFQVAINYGMGLADQGRLDEAIEWWEKSIEMNPEYWVAYNNLGTAYLDKGEPERAKEYFLKVIELSNSALGWENLAVLYWQENDPSLIQTLQQGLQYYPGNQKLRLIYARAASPSADLN